MYLQRCFRQLYLHSFQVVDSEEDFQEAVFRAVSGEDSRLIHNRKTVRCPVFPAEVDLVVQAVDLAAVS